METECIRGVTLDCHNPKRVGCVVHVEATASSQQTDHLHRLVLFSKHQHTTLFSRCMRWTRGFKRATCATVSIPMSYSVFVMVVETKMPHAFTASAPLFEVLNSFPVLDATTAKSF